MQHFLSFLSSFFLLFHPGPQSPALPAGGFSSVRPTPIIFHQYPHSGISVNWGSLAPDFTIFMDPDAKPCDHTERTITITNHKSQSRPLTIRGTKTEEAKNFSQVLQINIFKDGNLIYGPVTLAQFFTDSASAAGVPLGNLAGNSTSTYKIVIDFPCSAGNEYQLAKIVFNLKIGKLLKIPDRCRRFHTDSGDFTVSSRNRQVFTTFDCQDKIDDHDPYSCSAHP